MVSFRMAALTSVASLLLSGAVQAQSTPDGAPKANDLDGGLPGPALPRTAPAPVSVERGQRVVFTTSNETGRAFNLVLASDGTFTIASPGRPVVSGKASPEELSAIRRWNLSSDDLKRAKDSPVGRTEVLGRRPYTIAVETPAASSAFLRAHDLERLATLLPRKTQRFEGTGDGPSASGTRGNARLAEALNGLVDRATGGELFARTGETITGTLGHDPAFGVTVTDATGKVYVVDTSTTTDSPFTTGLRGLLAECGGDEARIRAALEKAYGTNVTVRGAVDRSAHPQPFDRPEWNKFVSGTGVSVDGRGVRHTLPVVKLTRAIEATRTAEPATGLIRKLDGGKK